MVAAIVTTSPGPGVLDVGCGTGIAARQFQAARLPGARGGSRPADGRSGPAVRGDVEVATFEDWDPAGRAFDAVIAGQAWHWVDPVAGAARAAQALRPGGRLAVFWNSSRPPAGLGEAFAAVHRRVLPDSPLGRGALPGPDAYSALCTKAADGMRQAGAFGDPQEWRFDRDQPYTRDEWLDVVPTFGGFSQFPRARQEELLAGLGAAIDAVGGSFIMGYTAVVATAVRAGAA